MFDTVNDDEKNIYSFVFIKIIEMQRDYIYVKHTIQVISRQKSIARCNPTRVYVRGNLNIPESFS